MAQWFIENWKLAAVLINALFVIVVWAMTKTFAKKDDLSALTERVSKVEGIVEDLPSVKELHELDKSLIEVSGKLDAVIPQLDGLKRTTDLLMENELRGSRSGNA